VATIGGQGSLYTHLHDLIAKIDVFSISLGQTETYSQVLKQIMATLSPTVVFQSLVKKIRERDRVVVTDNWFVYWAKCPVEALTRDTLELVDQLIEKYVVPHPTCWALNRGIVDHDW